MQPSTDPQVPCSSSLLHFGTHTSGGRGSVESELGMFRSRSRVPKVHFPQFVGDNPKLWISRCCDYFDLYGVESTDWIKIASMHFSDAAARWLQSVESRVRSLSWEDFCALVLERFGRDEHALLIRQLFHIKQDGSVSDYIDKFTGLVDQIHAYESTPDPLYFTLRFVDGLRDDLRASVLVQRPSDLDTACLLAQLQEEVLEPVQKKELRKPEFFSPMKYPPKQPHPLPPPPRLDRGAAPSVTSPADRRQVDPGRSRSVDDRLSALCAYRRARGLCDKCAEKWSRGHRCAEQVQLHALQEVWDLCHMDFAVSDSDPVELSSEPDQLCALSSAAVQGTDLPKTIQLHGFIQNMEVLILVDSGSSSTFIDAVLAAKLPGIISLPQPVPVKLADGGMIHCTSYFPSLQ